MRAIDVLDELGVEKCPECRCTVGGDWEYIPFSNKDAVECPQCKEIIFLEEYK